MSVQISMSSCTTQFRGIIAKYNIRSQILAFLMSSWKAGSHVTKEAGSKMVEGITTRGEMA